MEKLFLQDYSGNGKIFVGKQASKNINDATTLHPVKDPAYMYRLHVYFNNERIQDLQQRGERLQRVLRNMDRLRQANRLSPHEKLGLQDARDIHYQLVINNSEKWEVFTSKSFYPDIGLKAPVTKIHGASENKLSLQKKRGLQGARDFHHQLVINNSEKWEMFTFNLFYTDISLEAPVTKISGALKIEVNNILENIKEVINEDFRNNQHLGKLKNQKIHYGYRRVHPLYGTQHIVQLTVIGIKRSRNSKTNKPETIHIPYERSFYTQQPFANLRYTTEPLAGIPPYVHFLVPLEGRLETFRRFMANFELVCLKVLQRVKLVVAYSSSVSSPHEHKDIMKKYQQKYPEAELIWLDVGGDFSRGIALSLAANKFDQAALLFFCDVDLIFNSEFIDRCRLNTALGKRVYFPIMFSQFDPELTYSNKTKPDSHFTINKDAGFWRTFSYGPACIYHQDMDAVGGFDTSIRGWGLEDSKLFDKFVHHPEVEVFRAVDPGVIHVYHRKDCDPKLSVTQYKHCQGSKAAILASQKSLVRALLSTQNAND